VSWPLLCTVVISFARGHDYPTGMPEQLRFTNDSAVISRMPRAGKD
jgi:hypothetical protein